MIFSLVIPSVLLMYIIQQVHIVIDHIDDTVYFILFSNFNMCGTPLKLEQNACRKPSLLSFFFH